MIDRDVNDEDDPQKGLARMRELHEIRRMLRAKIVDPPYIEGETEMDRGNGNFICDGCGYSFRLHPDYRGVLYNDEPFLVVLCDGKTLVHL